MVDTIRTRPDLVTLLATNGSALINAQNVRDFLASVAVRPAIRGIKDIVDDYSGRLNDSSNSAVTANNAAIAAARAEAVAGVSGGFKYDGALYFSSQIVFPIDGGNHVLNFAIQQETPWSRLHFVGDRSQPAILMPSSSGLPPYTGGEGSHWLDRVFLYNGGIQIIGGGKFRRSDRCVIAGGPTSGYALDVSAFDGGQLWFNVHDCINADAIRIDNSHSTVVELLARVNGGRGLVITNSGQIDGRCNAESNGDFNVDFAGLVRSRLGLWLEDAHNGEAPPYNRFQGKLRECWGNVFSGQTSEQSFDMDALSALTNIFASGSTPAPINFDTLGTLVNGDGTVKCLNRPNWNASTQLTNGSGDGLTFTMKTGAFALGATPRYMALQQASGVGLQNLSWNAGDYLIWSFDVTTSTADWQFLQSALWTPFRLNTNAGTVIDSAQDIRPTRPGTWHYVSPPIRLMGNDSDLNTTAGSFILELDSGSGGVGPTQDYSFTLSNLNCRIIRNT